MKKINWTLCLFILTISVSSTTAEAIDCLAQKRAYQDFSQQIQVRTNEDAKRVTPQFTEDIRKKLKLILEQAIQNSLNRNTELTPEELRRELQCIQGQGRPEEDNPDLPYVISLEDDATQHFLITYVINAGGEGIPDSLPYLSIWTHDKNGWNIQYTDMRFYQRSIYVLHRVTVKGSSHPLFLISGKEYGDSSSRLKLMLLSVQGDHTITTWRVFDFNAGTVALANNLIEVKYLPRSGLEKYQTCTYTVSADGAVSQVPKVP